MASNSGHSYDSVLTSSPDGGWPAANSGSSKLLQDPASSYFFLQVARDSWPYFTVSRLWESCSSLSPCLSYQFCVSFLLLIADLVKKTRRCYEISAVILPIFAVGTAVETLHKSNPDFHSSFNYTSELRLGSYIQYSDVTPESRNSEVRIDVYC
jgi:hypothetical protein